MIESGVSDFGENLGGGGGNIFLNFIFTFRNFHFFYLCFYFW